MEWLSGILPGNAAEYQVVDLPCTCFLAPELKEMSQWRQSFYTLLTRLSLSLNTANMESIFEMSAKTISGSLMSDGEQAV